MTVKTNHNYFKRDSVIWWWKKFRICYILERQAQKQFLLSWGHTVLWVQHATLTFVAVREKSNFVEKCYARILPPLVQQNLAWFLEGVLTAQRRKDNFSRPLLYRFNVTTLRAILQESEANLEMKILTPLNFLCGGRLSWGINKNSHIWIDRCIVAVVTALDDVGLRTIVWPKYSLSKSKNKRVWFSGACEPIQMKFIQMVEPLSQFRKFAVKVFWVL